jgi:hypothetical protein
VAVSAGVNRSFRTFFDAARTGRIQIAKGRREELWAMPVCVNAPSVDSSGRGTFLDYNQGLVRPDRDLDQPRPEREAAN